MAPLGEEVEGPGLEEEDFQDEMKAFKEEDEEMKAIKEEDEEMMAIKEEDEEEEEEVAHQLLQGTIPSCSTRSPWLKIHGGISCRDEIAPRLMKTEDYVQ